MDAQTMQSQRDLALFRNTVTQQNDSSMNEIMHKVVEVVGHRLGKLEGQLNELQKVANAYPPSSGIGAAVVASGISAGAGHATDWKFRVEWDVSRKDLSPHKSARSIDSPEFALGETNGLVLRFQPDWNKASQTCMLAVVAPCDMGLDCVISIDGERKQGKVLPVQGRDLYYADFPKHPDGHYRQLAVEFIGKHQGELTLS